MYHVAIVRIEMGSDTVFPMKSCLAPLLYDMR